LRVALDGPVFGKRVHDRRQLVAERRSHVVDVPWRVLDDVVQQRRNLRALVGTRFAQDVGHGLRMRNALAGPDPNALVRVDEEADRGGANRASRGHGYAHSERS
jgi:hypothetical protein